LYFLTEVKQKESKYCLLHVDQYNHKEKVNKLFSFVDPGVHYLMKYEEYPHIDQLHDLAKGGLLENEYISIDYPGDMFPEKCDEFIAKSIANNLKYAENPKYICTIQFKIAKFEIPEVKPGEKTTKIKLPIAKPSVNDFPSFKENFENLEHIFLGKDKVVGVGNLCRVIHTNKFLDKMVDYITHKSRGNGIFKNKRLIKWVHFYGFSMRCIKKYIPRLKYSGIIVSADSLKWTRPVTNTLKNKYMINQCQRQLAPVDHEQKGLCAGGVIRDEFFLEYMKEINRAGIKVKY
jgi:hypothetical protein